jgi:hypothetical protein
VVDGRGREGVEWAKIVGHCSGAPGRWGEHLRGQETLLSGNSAVGGAGVGWVSLFFFGGGGSETPRSSHSH